jgi:hypothetical protein
VVAGQEDPWIFTLPDGPPHQAVLTVLNHSVGSSNDGNYDFAGHLALRQNMDSDSAAVPLPTWECREMNDNPQCSPANNQWP